MESISQCEISNFLNHRGVFLITFKWHPHCGIHEGQTVRNCPFLRFKLESSAYQTNLTRFCEDSSSDRRGVLFFLTKRAPLQKDRTTGKSD